MAKKTTHIFDIVGDAQNRLLSTFAKSRCLAVLVDECGDGYIKGKKGIIYGYSTSALAVYIKRQGPSSVVKSLALLLGVGCRAVQVGDYEGACAFNPIHKTQYRAAMRAAGIKRHRVVSRDHIDKMLASASRARIGRMDKR